MAETIIARGIPIEIISNILTRLPVKSLFRFKIVERAWLALISSSEFIKAHLERANYTDNFMFHRLIFIEVRPSIPQIISHSFDFNTFTKLTANLPFSDQSLNPEVVASYDGLVLLYKNHMTHLLWNPSTREFKEILGLHQNKHDGVHSYVRLYGIAYDAITDGYKVITVAQVPNLQNQETLVTVYDCRTSTCNYMVGFPFRNFRNQQGAVVNGVPHWLICRDGSDDDTWAIIYFDLYEETFKEVPKPDWDAKCGELDLRAFSGFLCLVHYKRGYADVWVMEKYGVQESWTKLYDYVRSSRPLDVRPLGLTNDAKVVMEVDQTRVATYDPKARRFSNMNVYSCYNNGFNAITYLESLVSPNPENL